MNNNIRITYCILILLSFILFLYLDYINVLITYDETYSENLIKFSFKDLTKITTDDVHPPLYYWGLKIYSAILGTSMFALRSFSALGMLMVILLGRFPIRRLFGDKVAIIFIILIIIFPVTQYLATEIRMYSWCMFSVLACALFAYDVYKLGRLVDWTKFFIAGICAAYLHNYGLLSVFWIYVLLLIFMLSAKKNWKSLIICGFLFSIVYLPWLIQLLQQLNNISTSYWIEPLTLNDLFLHIYYFYSPKEIWYPFTFFTKNQMMVALVFIMAIQLFISIRMIYIGIKNKDSELRLALLFFIAFLLPILTGFIYSLVSAPVIVTRYMTCSFGLFAISMAVIFAKAIEYPFLKRLVYLFLILLLIDGAIRIYTGIEYCNDAAKKYKQIRNFVNSNESERPPIVVNYYSWNVLPCIQKITSENSANVLVPNSTVANFEPFELTAIKEEPSDKEFILLHKPKEKVSSYFSRNDFVITDSLSYSDVIFYKVMQNKK